MMAGRSLLFRECGRPDLFFMRREVAMADRLFDDSEENKALFFFEEISRIPRESGHEEKIAEYLLDFAGKRGLDAEKDSVGNVIIRRSAAEGRENEEPLILQAHMDMVCEKVPESTHDFSKDPIALIADGDILRADGTTLGADDGIGVALCLAALDDDKLSCPPLEVLITVEEETTFRGAAGAEQKYFRGRRIINLDHAVEHQVLCGSCGGEACHVRIPVADAEVPDGLTAFRISISGMHGGHSGEDIHRGYGSAIQLIIRMLRRLYAELEEVHLAEVSGGTNRLAISRDAAATVLVPEKDSVKLCGLADSISELFRKEYNVTGADMVIKCEKVKAPAYMLTDESFGHIISLMSIAPDGIQKMSGAVPGVVESSLNIGEIRILSGKEETKTEAENEPAAEQAEQFELVAEVRGAFRSTVEDIIEKLSACAELFGGDIITHDSYSAWSFDPDSELRAKAVQVYRDVFGEELQPLAVHAGIEIGLFMDSFDKLDAISLGPDCWSFHSPDEHMSISSARREWKFLKALISAV